MRIIDKNYDFYDYLQDYTDTIVFDRRNSFLMTKRMLLEKIFVRRMVWGNKHHLLLQCGARYWLFLVEFTAFEHIYPTDCTIELLHTWVNHNKPRVVTKINLVETYWYYGDKVKDIVSAIDNNDCRYSRDFNNFTKYIGDHEEECDIPLLKACGLGELIDPVEIFTALEEHFSLLKSEAERVDPLGATNNDKIEMHGFDTKSSFRGKY